MTDDPTATGSESGIRAALTAVLPIHRNEVIEECAAEMHPMLRSMVSRGDAATAIRALKSKDTKL